MFIIVGGEWRGGEGDVSMEALTPFSLKYCGSVVALTVFLQYSSGLIIQVWIVSGRRPVSIDALPPRQHITALSLPIRSDAPIFNKTGVVLTPGRSHH